MKKRNMFLGAMLLLGGGFFAVSSLEEGSPANIMMRQEELPHSVPNEIIIIYKDTAPVMQIGDNIPNSQSVGKRKAKDILKENIKKDLQGKIEKDIEVIPKLFFQEDETSILNNSQGRIVYAQAKSSTKSTEEMIKILKDDPEVELVEPNYLYYPTAENAKDLWHIYNNLSGAGVSADKAWEMGATGKGIVVAVVDTGVDLKHPDLAANIWKNTAETNCQNAIDDDGNGYTDDCWGWDTADGDNNPGEGHFHGTHVSGTIAAVRNNAGAIGVAPDAKIMAIKVFSNNVGQKGTSTSAILEGMEYATNNGADIINMSLGGSEICQPNSVFGRAARIVNNAGVMIIASSGNSGPNIPNSPASCPKVYGIGATDASKELAGFSSYWGETVDFVTPGVDIISTVTGGKYAMLSGTSMSSPHAAGVAALVLSKNPSLSPEEIGRIMCDNAEDMGIAGRDEKFGCGFLNAEKILKAMGGVTTTPLSATPVSQTVKAENKPQPILVSGGTDYTYTLDAGGTGIEKLDCANGKKNLCSLTPGSAAGTATLVITAEEGRSATATIIVQKADNPPSLDCKLINQAYDSLQKIFFVPPFDVFSEDQKSILDVFSCGSSLRLKAGNSSPQQYIWKDIYITKGRKWQQRTLDFKEVSANKKWGIGQGEATFDLSEEEQKRGGYAAVYICVWDKEEWKCGCEDRECSKNSRGKWYLRTFRKE